MPDVELARRPDVELIRTGSWGALTGTWNPTRADILAAVEAQKCPAVRRPRIKLGHTDERFAGDGEPALGWFENLRTTDGGHTLVGDQMALPWLSQVQAAAYPDRSIEGNYRHRCALGHEHPFVLTAVALLGVTPPAVSTLRSVQDLPQMLGVAASSEVPEGAEHVEVTIRAAAEVHTGAMVALIPTVEDAERLAVEGGEPAEQLHVTLAYLGDAADLGARGQQDVIDGVSTAANGLPQFDAEAFALNCFKPPGAQRDDGKDRDSCIVLGLSGDPIDAVHDLIEAALREALWSVPTPAPHRPWHAHMTLEYTEDLSKLAGLVDRIGPIRFDRIRIAFGGQHVDIPLIAPDDEMTDVAASAADSIRARVAPIEARLAHLEGVKAGAGNGVSTMSRAQQIRDAWNASGAPHTQWVQEARPDAAVVVDDTDRSYRLVPVTFDGDQVVFGEPQPYDPAADQVLVFASAAESRPEAPVAPAGTPETPPEVTPPATSPAPILPAAEPEPVNTDPKEDLVSTDLSALRSRLGLDDTADMDAALAAVDALKAKADTPTPTPEMVAASAAAEAEKSELQTTVSKLEERMTAISAELSAAKSAQAATVKASVFDAAVKDGKLKPADREQWEADYDEAPGAITRVLASIAPGTAVPVMASGTTGSPEPTDDMTSFEADLARLDGPKAV
jgi:2'-5' RNA ligase